MNWVNLLRKAWWIEASKRQAIYVQKTDAWKALLKGGRDE